MTRILFIGPTRTGTTSIWKAMKENVPDVSTTNQKEIYFFDKNYHLGYEWYNNRFSSGKTNLQIEISPSYFHSETAIDRIYQDMPFDLIIVSIRDPLNLCFSSYQYNKINGKNVGSFQNFLENGVLRHYSYREKLPNIQANFPGKLKYFLYPDFVDAPEQYLLTFFQDMGFLCHYQKNDLIIKSSNSGRYNVRLPYLYYPLRRAIRMNKSVLSFCRNIRSAQLAHKFFLYKNNDGSEIEPSLTNLTQHQYKWIIEEREYLYKETSRWLT